MAVLDYVTGTLDSARRQADRVVAPEARQRASHTVQSFAEQRPHLFVSFMSLLPCPAPLPSPGLPV